MKSFAFILLSAALLTASCGGSDSATPSPNAVSTSTTAASRPSPVPTIDLSIVADWLKPAFNDDPSLPGAYVKPNPGPDGRLLTRDDFEHFTNGVVMPICGAEQIARDQITACYNSNPPTSGPHAVSAASFLVHPEPAPKESLVHSMEHGGVVIWYNTTSGKAIALLAAITKEALEAGKLVVMSPYPDMETDTIALTAWTRLDKFRTEDLTPLRVSDFIAAHERRFNPEGF